MENEKWKMKSKLCEPDYLSETKVVWVKSEKLKIKNNIFNGIRSAV
jgi:hypothetical protein